MTRTHHTSDGDVECDDGRIDNGIQWRECPYCAEELEDWRADQAADNWRKDDDA